MTCFLVGKVSESEHDGKGKGYSKKREGWISCPCTLQCDIIRADGSCVWRLMCSEVHNEPVVRGWMNHPRNNAEEPLRYWMGVRCEATWAWICLLEHQWIDKVEQEGEILMHVSAAATDCEVTSGVDVADRKKNFSCIKWRLPKS